MPPLTLNHGQHIRIAAWADTVSAEVFTTRGYAIENGNSPDEAEALARSRGHALVGTMYSSGALVGDRALGAKLLADARARAEGAAKVDVGDTVEIEGRLYTVLVMRGNSGRFPTNCDPIHFKPL